MIHDMCSICSKVLHFCKGLIEKFPQYAKKIIELIKTLSLIHHSADGKDKHPKFIFPSNFMYSSLFLMNFFSLNLLSVLALYQSVAENREIIGFSAGMKYRLYGK